MSTGRRSRRRAAPGDGTRSRANASTLAAEGALVLGPAVDVVEDTPRQAPTGDGTEIGHRCRPPEPAGHRVELEPTEAEHGPEGGDHLTEAGPRSGGAAHRAPPIRGAGIARAPAPTGSKVSITFLLCRAFRGRATDDSTAPAGSRAPPGRRPARCPRLPGAAARAGPAVHHHDGHVTGRRTFGYGTPLGPTYPQSPRPEYESKGCRVLSGMPRDFAPPEWKMVAAEPHPDWHA